MNDTIKEAVLALAETNPDLVRELLAATTTEALETLGSSFHAGNFLADMQHHCKQAVHAGVKNEDFESTAKHIGNMIVAAGQVLHEVGLTRHAAKVIDCGNETSKKARNIPG